MNKQKIETNPFKIFSNDIEALKKHLLEDHVYTEVLDDQILELEREKNEIS